MINEHSMVKFDRDKRERLRKHYEQAVKEQKISFTFDGHELLVSYAKYLLEYLDMRPADIDTKFTALALIYGRPDFGRLLTQNLFVPLAFRIALEKVFEPEEVKRVGLRWFAYDYASWYERNSKRATRSVTRSEE